MGKMIHARLDQESAALLAELERSLDSNTSEVIRQALRFLSRATVPTSRKKIIGLGKFSSSKSDRGSNKKHLLGFGE
jgi:Arc/MetJ-type ribon-helix-helix transcriptional regulator